AIQTRHQNAQQQQRAQHAHLHAQGPLQVLSPHPEHQQRQTLCRGQVHQGRTPEAPKRQPIHGAQTRRRVPDQAGAASGIKTLEVRQVVLGVERPERRAVQGGRGVVGRTLGEANGGMVFEGRRRGHAEFWHGPGRTPPDMRVDAEPASDALCPQCADAIHRTLHPPMSPSQIIVLATPVFFVLIAVEYAIGLKRQHNTYRLDDAITSIGLGMLSQISAVFTRLLRVGIYTAVYSVVAIWPDHPFWTTWVGWLVALVFYDFCYYWLHRAGHESAIFWAAHVVHHQSQDYNLSTALRQTSSGALLGWLFYLPMAIAGVP